MTLRRFIDVGFAVLVEEYQRLGTDLLTALEKVGALGLSAEEAAVEAVVPTPADNAQSMSALMGMLGGVKGAPV
jgi:hypothetical protein